MTRTFGEAFAGRFNFAPVHPGDIRSVSLHGLTGGSRVRSSHLRVPDRSDFIVVIGCWDFSMRRAFSKRTRIAGRCVSSHETICVRLELPFLMLMCIFHRGRSKPIPVQDSHRQAGCCGPLYDQWPPVSHRRLFGDLPVIPFSRLPPDAPKPTRPAMFREARGAINGPGRLVPGAAHSDNPPADIRRLLSQFLPRAFRRPVDPIEIERYAAIADQRLREGSCFEDALLDCYRTALISPDFLFLTESVGQLDNYALAARLSYALWNSCPDDALLEVARNAELHDPQALRTVVDRMLSDSRAERFYRDFPDQWLDLRDFDLTSPDKQLYPEFQPNLEDAMRREPREFFKYAVLNKLPVSHLWSTSINIVNQRLAEHYGIDGVLVSTFVGSTLIRIKIREVVS